MPGMDHAACISFLGNTCIVLDKLRYELHPLLSQLDP
jgi:hypothetical protein